MKLQKQKNIWSYGINIRWLICLWVLMLYVPVKSFQLCRDDYLSYFVEPVLSTIRIVIRILLPKCLELATLRPPVQRSTNWATALRTPLAVNRELATLRSPVQLSTNWWPNFTSLDLSFISDGTQLIWRHLHVSRGMRFPTLCGILTWIRSDWPVQPPFNLRNSKWCSVSSLIFSKYSSG